MPLISLEQHKVCVCDKTHNTKRTLSLLEGTVHAGVQPSPPSIHRTCHLVKLKLSPLTSLPFPGPPLPRPCLSALSLQIRVPWELPQVSGKTSTMFQRQNVTPTLRAWCVGLGSRGAVEGPQHQPVETGRSISEQAGCMQTPALLLHLRSPSLRRGSPQCPPPDE